MGVKFEFESIPELPRLALAARVRKDDPAIQVMHGPWVETREDCFFEGAWDGPFEEGRFDQAETFAGSGGRIIDDGIVFSGPSHTFERLFAIRAGDEFHLSNSLAFVLAASGERLDPDYRHYYVNFLDFNRDGIRTKQKRLRLEGPRCMELHDCCNVMVEPDLTTTRLERALGPPPRNYSGYFSFLTRTLEGVLANAAHSNRRQTYQPVTQLSQGYDSVAVSALASRAGCRESVSFRKSNSVRGYEHDSGREIARYLELRLTEFERTDYHKLGEQRGDEFYIEPDGIDRYMVLMEPQLSGSVLLTGRFGERLWEIEKFRRFGLPGDTGNPDFQLPTGFRLGGCSMGEFRLRTGFLHFPVPCAGGLHAPAIRAISESEEMKPWSVGGGYDRPIARRIAEEAGVPRHLFGQLKKGGPCRWERRSWAGRVAYSAWEAAYWPPLRLLTLRLTGNVLNPAWRRGSLDVQRRLERIRERYVAAMAGVASSRQLAKGI